MAFPKDPSLSTFTIFTIVGVIIVSLGVFFFINTYQFIQTAIPASGKIIGAATYHSSKNGTTYAPVIEYTTAKDETITFTANTSSSFYPTINSRVDVLYNPQKPQEANINSAYNLWTGPAILGLLGTIFFLTGGIGLFRRIKRRNEINKLKMTGQKYVTKVCGIEQTSTRINRIPGKRIITEYSQGGNTINLKSDVYYVLNIENNVHIGDEIDVYIDPASPQKYYLDVKNIRIKPV